MLSLFSAIPCHFCCFQCPQGSPIPCRRIDNLMPQLRLGCLVGQRCRGPRISRSSVLPAPGDPSKVWSVDQKGTQESIHHRFARFELDGTQAASPLTSRSLVPRQDSNHRPPNAAHRPDLPCGAEVPEAAHSAALRPRLRHGCGQSAARKHPAEDEKPPQGLARLGPMVLRGGEERLPRSVRPRKSGPDSPRPREDTLELQRDIRIRIVLQSAFTTVRPRAPCQT